MKLSTVIIITCRANEINSLNELVIPECIDWRNYPHKYIVVITNAYGQGTIKKYFKYTRVQRNSSFLEYVTNKYKENLEIILGSSSQIEFFPVDIGDSLERFSKYSELDEVDSKEVIDTAYDMAEKIRESIQKRDGNKLKSIIKDLNAYIKEDSEYKIAGMKEKIRELKGEEEELSYNIEKNGKLAEKSKKALAELEEDYKSYKSLKNIVVELDISQYFMNLEEYIGNETKNGKMKANKKNELLKKYKMS